MNKLDYADIFCSRMLDMANNEMDVDSNSFDDWTTLRTAVILQQPQVILYLLKQNVKFTCTDEDGNTVLHMVFQECTFSSSQSLIIEILNIFLVYGMDPDVMNNEGKTALHLAIKSRLCDVIDFLISKGANLNIRDRDGDTIAHFVVDNEFDIYCRTCWSESYAANKKSFAQNKCKDFVRWLISKGLIVDYKNKDGLIPVHLAAQLNMQFIMLELLDCTRTCCVNFVNKNNENILHSLFNSFKAIEPIGFKNEKKSLGIPFGEDKTIFSRIVKSLLDKEVSVDAVDKNGNTPFHLAMKLTEPDITQLLLKKFTNVNACDSDGNTLIHIILMDFRRCHNNIYDVYVRTLLLRGANIHIKNNNGLVPLQLAVSKERMNIAKIFKNYGADFQVLHENGSLLHFFSRSGPTEMNRTDCRSAIDLLVSEGCDVNGRNQFGMTPLHLALRSRNVYVVDRLIELGADKKAKELFQEKYTTLHLAVMYGYEDIVSFIQAGIDVNVQDASGQTPLHLASHDAKFLKKLLSLGAYVDRSDYRGNLPLHIALKCGNLEGLKELFRHGADLNDANTRGEIEALITRKPIAVAILEHCLKLKMAGLPAIDLSTSWINMYYVNGVLFHNETFQFRINCAIEVEKLKKINIVGKKTYYDFLHMNRNRQCAFVKKNDIMKKLYEFKIYEPVICGAYHQATEREPLLRSALSVWYKLTNHYLPDICVEHIYSYLNNPILSDIIKSVENCNDKLF